MARTDFFLNYNLSTLNICGFNSHYIPTSNIYNNLPFDRD